MTNQYRYHLRPGYGSKNLLIEFIGIKVVSELMIDLRQLLSKNGFSLEKITYENLGDDELHELISADGKVIISKDLYDCVFILADDNQADLLRIDEILLESGRFVKEPVNVNKFNADQHPKSGE